MVTNLGRRGEKRCRQSRDGAIIKLMLSSDQSAFAFRSKFAGNEGMNTAKSSLPTWAGF